MEKLKFPENKNFAFTILDDTDYATTENVKPIYEVLFELGIITTKTVWVFPTEDTRNPNYNSKTLANNEYLYFIKWLVESGFEIALHNASMESSTRDKIISAIERFNELLGSYPKIHVNHHLNRDNLYWGQNRVDFPLIKLGLKLFRGNTKSYGHISESPYFWGDICQNYIKYVRNLVFKEINLLKINPTLPYKDPTRPYVNYWFSSSEGANVKSFNDLISERNQDRLEREGGVCIIYTHFANGFVERGKINQKTKDLLTELSKRDGWFVPVSHLLDYLITQQKHSRRPYFEKFRMEMIWFFSKLIHGTS
jgi:hypothetical protein